MAGSEGKNEKTGHGLTPRGGRPSSIGLVDAVSDLVFEIDEQGLYRFANARHEPLLQLLASDLVGRSIFERVHPEDAGILRDLQVSGCDASAELRFMKGNDEWVRLLVSAVLPPTHGQAGAMIVAQVGELVAVDEEADLTGDALFRAVLEHLPQSIIIFDVEKLRPVYHNPGYHAIFSRPRVHSRQRTREWLDRIHPDDRERVKGWLREQFEKPTHQSYRFEREDGSLRWIEGITFLVPGRDGRPRRMVGIARDVTEQHIAREALRVREERFRSVAESLPGVAYLARLADPPEYLYLSDRVEEITGLPADDFRSGRRTIAALIHPDDRVSYVEELGSALAENRPALFIYRIAHASGDWRWVEQRGQAVMDEQGKPRLFGGAVFDVTERVRGDLQRRQLESKLFQLQKLESLGAMAGGVAHDFNNMIGIVMASAELAMLQLDADHPSRTLFEESLAATQKAAALTKQLLAYAGRGVASVEPKPLLAPVREACDLLERALPERITLHRELPETLAASEMDATQIQQVLMNLIMNSQEAIGDEAGRIEVQVGERVLDEADTRRLIGSELRARDRCVYVQVSDDGPGMNAEVLDRIFDPFFTTKSDGHGLGLAALLGIVLAHRGGVEVESRPGQGTRFRILLPVCDDASEASMVDDGLRGEGLVLVVDDERVMREIACKVLSHYGYETMMAENGRQALDLVAKHAGEISLVLLDIQMPGLMGHEVFPLLRGIRPDLPVILSSAFGEYEKVSHLAREPRSAFLAKPYGARDLARMLRSVLDSEGAGQA